MIQTVWKRLNTVELMFGAEVGMWRMIQDIQRGCSDHGGDPENQWSRNIDGSLGELAFKKWRNIYAMPSLGNYKEIDAGPYQVRTNCSRSYTDMVIRQRDIDDGTLFGRPWISVLGFCPDYEILGWYWGEDCLNKAWQRPGTKGLDPSWTITYPIG